MSFVENMMLFVAPPTCLVCGHEGEPLCAACTSVNLTPYGRRCYVCGRLSSSSKTCPKCSRLGGPKHVWINALYEATAERLIDAFKFNSGRNVGRFLARQMALNLPSQDYLLVPVPTAPTRIRERGFDHTILLAREIARLTGQQYAKALTRKGQLRQVGSSRADRMRHAISSYGIKSPSRIAGKRIVLIDDVTTTGATLQATAKILRANGAKNIDALVFAKRI